MSLMSMRRKMASKRTAAIILWVLIIVFLIGVVLWSVPKTPVAPTGPKAQYNGPDKEQAVAMLNGEKITSADFNNAYLAAVEQQDKNQSPKGFDTTLSMRSQAFLGVMLRQMTDQVLHKYGIHLDDGYLHKLADEYADLQMADLHTNAIQQAAQQAATAKTPEEKKKLKTADMIFTEQLASFMNSMSTGSDTPPTPNPTETEFKNFFVNEYLMKKMYEQFSDNGRLRLLGAHVIKSLPVNPLTEEYVKKQKTQEINARYIFIAAKEKGAASVEEALKKATALHDQVAKDPKSFAAIAKANSDDSSKMKDGSLGWVQADKMFFPMMAEYQVFSQKPGELGPVVQISSSVGGEAQVGYGFVIVDGIRNRADLPKDFNWEKEKTLDVNRSAQRYETGMGDSYQMYLRYTADVKCLRHEISAIWLEMAKETSKAVPEWKLALKEDPNMPEEVAAAISHKVAMSTTDLKEKAALLVRAIPYAGQQTSDLHYQLGMIYLQLKDNNNAREQFNYAVAGSMDKKMHENVRAAYKQLGYDAGMKEMDDWLKKDSASEKENSVTMPIPH